MFENDETAILIEKKLLPVLEELARAEFQGFSMTGNVDTETEGWMARSEMLLEATVSVYLRGLMNTHIETGRQLQRLKTSREVLGCDLDHGGD